MGATLRVMVAKLVFDQMAAPVPDIVDDSLYIKSRMNFNNCASVYDVT
jgi:hypothetical protein